MSDAQLNPETDDSSSIPESTMQLFDELDEMFDVDHKQLDFKDDEIVCISIKELRYFIKQELKEALRNFAKPTSNATATCTMIDKPQTGGCGYSSLGEKQGSMNDSLEMVEKMSAVQKWVEQQKCHRAL